MGSIGCSGLRCNSMKKAHIKLLKLVTKNKDSLARGLAEMQGSCTTCPRCCNLHNTQLDPKSYDSPGTFFVFMISPIGLSKLNAIRSQRLKWIRTVEARVE